MHRRTGEANLKYAPCRGLFEVGQLNTAITVGTP